MVTSQLTPELQHAVELANDQSPVTLIDPTTNCRYVLLREEVFERCRSLIGVEGFDPADFTRAKIKLPQSPGIIPTMRPTIITMS